MPIGWGTYIAVTAVIQFGVAWYQSEQQKKAQKAQQDAIDKAQEAMAPWREKQLAAFGEYEKLLKAGPGEYTESPGYETQLAGGVTALDRAAASRGRVRGGAQQKAITRYGQNLAKRDYGSFLKNYYDRLNAWGRGAGLEPPSMPSEVNALINAGNINAQGYTTQGNIVGQTAQNLGNTMWDYYLIDTLRNDPYGLNAPTYGQVT